MFKAKRIVKYLILLAFFGMCSAGAPPKVQPTQNEAPKAKEKGPVYHPLRVKPYTKFSMKA